MERILLAIYSPFSPVFTVSCNKSLVLASYKKRVLVVEAVGGVVTHRGKEATNEIPLTTSQRAVITVLTRHIEKTGATEEESRRTEESFLMSSLTLAQ